MTHDIHREKCLYPWRQGYNHRRNNPMKDKHTTRIRLSLRNIFESDNEILNLNMKQILTDYTK